MPRRPSAPPMLRIMQPENDMSGDAVPASLLSVVVVNYNAGPLLAECIAAASAQAVRLIVIDNDSADGSADDCARVFGGLEQFSLVRNTRNLGFAAACNTGFAMTDSEFVLFLNPDCQLGNGAVIRLLEAIQNEPRAGMVGGLLLNLDGTEQGGGRRAVPTPWRSFVRAFGLSRLAQRWPKLFFDFHLHKQPLPDAAIEVEAISGACMLVRRAAVEDVGLWDERFFLHCEDLDWCMRFRQRGWTIRFVPSARVTHAIGACSRSRPFFVEWHKHKGMIRFYRKHFQHQYPGPLMWLVVAGVWLRFSFVSSYHAGRAVRRAIGADGNPS